MICNELGIDDPATWMNTVPPTVVDQWIAYHSLEMDEATSETKSAEQWAGGLKGLGSGSIS